MKPEGIRGAAGGSRSVTATGLGSERPGDAISPTTIAATSASSER